MIFLHLAVFALIIFFEVFGEIDIGFIFTDICIDTADFICLLRKHLFGGTFLDFKRIVGQVGDEKLPHEVNTGRQMPNTVNAMAAGSVSVEAVCSATVPK